MLIATAWAQDAAAAGGTNMGALLFSYAPLLLIVAVFYMLVIRPQNRAAKEHGELLAGLVKGDKVETQGGLRGTVTAVHAKSVTLALVEGEAEFNKDAVVRKLKNDDALVAKQPAKAERKK